MPDRPPPNLTAVITAVITLGFLILFAAVVLRAALWIVGIG